MAAAHKTGGTENHASSGSITLTLPSGGNAPAADDAGLIFVLNGGNDVLSISGWSLDRGYNLDANARINLFTRRMTGGDSNPTITGATKDIQANLVLATGCITTGSFIDVMSANQTNAASTTVTALGITPNNADALIYFFGAQYDTGSSTSTFSGYSGTNPTLTEVTGFDNNFQGSTINTNIFCAQGSQSGAAAATGNRTATATSSLVSAGWLVALVPAGGGGGGVVIPKFIYNYRRRQV